MHASREQLTPERPAPGHEVRLADWGDTTATFVRLAGGTDHGAYHDYCECPHWGYVFRGKIRFTYRDGGSEVVSAGEMYYAPPGHAFAVLEDAETLEFSPTEAYRRQMDEVARRLPSPARR